MPSASRRASTSDFNSRPSARGDSAGGLPTDPAVYFNSRPSARGDLGAGAGALIGIFQFTPLREGRQPAESKYNTLWEFQFTPLREGRLNLMANNPPFDYISIHAPPRGATKNWHETGRIEIYFNSRPSARGDGDVFSVQLVRKQFQFTPLREGRRVSSLCRHKHTDISIHAPPRGATFALSAIQSKMVISIHAPPRGATVWAT